MVQKLFFLSFFLLSVCFVSAQKPSDAKTNEETEKLRKEAVVFLRETMAEVNTMRSIENRLSFSAEMASLMWFYDEKEAHALCLSVMSDFQKLLVDFDTQLNNLSVAEAAGDDAYIMPNLNAPITDRANVLRKLGKAIEMRQQIAMSLAEHEPDMAMAFYYDSVSVLTNKEALESFSGRETYFELQLMAQVAESNTTVAARFAAKSLDNGVNYQHLELLKKIYAKDAEKGIEFGSAIVSKLKSGGSEIGDLSVISSLIRFSEETAVKPDKSDGKKPIMTTADIRDLVEVMAKSVLGPENSTLDDPEAVTSYMDLFEKYTPTRASQIRTLYRKKDRSSLSAPANTASTLASVNTPANSAVATAPNPDAERKAKAIEDRIKADAKIMEDVAALGTKPLAKEDREKIVAQARKVISYTPGVDKKITALSLLATKVAKAGDKELAGEIMRDAEVFVRTQPRNYQDYLMTWLLISGYAEVNPDKAFPLLTDTILRLNDTISAFVKAAEFIDISGEMIDDGEIQVGQFGGSMLRGLTKELKIAEPALRSMAKADFAKTKAVTNSFDRIEIRVLAKMLVLRTILDTKDRPDKEDQNIGLISN